MIECFVRKRNKPFDFFVENCLMGKTITSIYYCQKEFIRGLGFVILYINKLNCHRYFC